MKYNKEILELMKWAEEYKVNDVLQLCKTQNDEELLNSLKHLKSLDLSNRCLVEFNQGIFYLEFLEELNLSHNNLRELPINIVKLKHLKILDISWNHIAQNLNFLSPNIKVNSSWNHSIKGVK